MPLWLPLLLVAVVAFALAWMLKQSSTNREDSTALPPETNVELESLSTGDSQTEAQSSVPDLTDFERRVRSQLPSASSSPVAFFTLSLEFKHGDKAELELALDKLETLEFAEKVGRDSWRRKS